MYMVSKVISFCLSTKSMYAIVYLEHFATLIERNILKDSNSFVNELVQMVRGGF